MKKYYLLCLSILIVIAITIFVLFLMNKKSMILYFDGQKTEQPIKIYQIDEKSVIYTNYSKLYYVNNKQNKVDLGIALDSKLITIDEIIDKVGNKKMAMDGGSIVAENNSSKNAIANIDFTIIKCHKDILVPETNEVYTITDVYIGNFALENVCN